MPRRPRPLLSLGSLHRVLTAVVAPGPQASITLHFEQRSAMIPDGDGDARHSPDLFVTRRFDARLRTADTGVVEAELRTAGMSRKPTASVSVVRDEHGEALYTVDGVHFGRLDGRLDLFDQHRFQRRLDDVQLEDVVVDDVDINGESVVVLDIDIDDDAFRRMLQLFAESADESGDLTLRSHTVSMSAGRDVALDYWWSLAGDEPVEKRPYRHTVACHVQVIVVPSADPVAARAAKPTLPTMHHLDDVWQLARAAHLSSQSAAG
ncbi:MAG: hypothetical protein JOY80_08580 [Candidatus Dormibacteraeota bacterium]|nr:hypothetical protein [Candidatus Dormibacteraeota bacterium]